MEVMQRENEELRKNIDRQNSEIKTLRRDNVRYERRWTFFGQEKSCAITVPVSGSPKVKLDGPWTINDVRDVFGALTREVRLQIVAHRHQVEMGRKKPSLQPKNADNNQTEAKNPPNKPQMAMAGGSQKKEVTDE